VVREDPVDETAVIAVAAVSAGHWSGLQRVEVVFGLVVDYGAMRRGRHAVALR
jgi:hypothetical protein